MNAYLSECHECDEQCKVVVDYYECKECGKRVTDGRGEAWCERCDREWSATAKIAEEDREGKRIDSDWYCLDCCAAPPVWCPVCRVRRGDSKFVMAEGSFYLFKTFKDQPYSYHAAALVTHYRHNHIKGWDRAHSNPSYQDKIPGYDYDEQKVLINNRAKRVLLRAIKKLTKQHAIPNDIDAFALASAFDVLQDNDDKTTEMVKSVCQFLSDQDTKT